MTEPQEGGVGNFPELFINGLVDFLPSMPVYVGPQGGNPVQVAIAIDIEEVGTFPTLDEEGLPKIDFRVQLNFQMSLAKLENGFAITNPH